MEDMRGIPNLSPLRILYLGASTGTTVSHISDIGAQTGGKVLAVEFSIRPARRLIQLSQQRINILPIVSDARFPDRYASMVLRADFVFQDVSQSNQTDIFLDNMNAFLKPGCRALLIIKIKSIDAIAPDEDVVSAQLETLESAELKIVEQLDISKYEKAHRAILVQKT
jgi:fibrillarin-like pre-rRNA processing protein